MKKKKVILISIIASATFIVLALALALYFFTPSFSFLGIGESSQSQGVTAQGKSSGDSGLRERVPDRCASVQDSAEFDFSAVSRILEEEPFVNDLPGSGSVLLRFYHFTDGCRFWDKSYYLTEGKVEERGGEADISIWIDSSYAERLDSENLCDVIREAEANGALGRWTDLSAARLALRYGTLYKYRDCIGI